MFRLIKLSFAWALFIPALCFGAETSKPLAEEDSSFDTGKMAPDYRTYLGDIKFNNPTGVWDLVTSELPTPPPDVQASWFYHIAYEKGQPVRLSDRPRYYYESITPKQRAELMKKPRGW